MTILENVFEQLEAVELIETAEEYSLDWCNKSRSWFANRKHQGGEFGISAAINCLDRVNHRLCMMKFKTRRFGNLVDEEIETLERIQTQLEEFLLSHHRIAKVQLTELHQSKML
jgi:hypothetical protein